MITMKARTCLLTALLLFCVQAVFSQSIDDVKKDLYYEHYTTAKQNLQKIISSKATGEAYYLLGLADMGMDDLQAAKADFDKALQTDANAPLAYVGQGRIAIALDKNYAAAKQAFQKAWDLSEGRDFDVLRAILNAAALSPKADNQFALDLVDQFKNNRKNRKYTFTAADYTAIGQAYANLPDGGGKAATSYETAESTDPKYAKSFYEEGNLWDRAKQDSLALQYWTSAVNADANYGPALYQMFTYFRYRDLDKAKDYLNKYMALTDDPTNAKVNLVDVLYLQKNYQQAVDQANQLMGENVSEATKTRLYKLIAVSQLAQGDSLDAKKNMDTYFQKQDTDKILPFDYKTYADIMGKLNNDSMQLIYLNKFVNSDTSTNIPFIRKEAYTLREDGNFKAADLWFNKLFEKADTSQLNMADYYYRAFSKYGAALKGLGSYDSSVEEWKKFIAKYPDQSSGYYWLAQSLKAQDTAYKGLAIDAYNQYLSKLKPDELKDKTEILKIIYSYMAGCYYTQGDEAKATEFTGKLLTLDPHSPVAANVYANMAYKAAQAKDLDKATSGANKALEIDPNNQMAHQVLDYVKQLKDYNLKMQKYNESKKKSDK